MKVIKPITTPAATLSPAAPPSMVDNLQLLTVDETMRLLKIGRSKIYTLIQDGRLISVKIDSARRIKLASALALIEASTDQPNAI
jgi:excisionase family DNA binding protein